MATATAKAKKEVPLKFKKRRMTPLRWFLALGWRHMVGMAIVLYAIFPILYIISTSLYPNNSIDGTNSLFVAISGENYVNLFQDEARPFATWYFNTFTLIYLLTEGGPLDSASSGYDAGGTDILITFVYKIAFSSGGGQDYGLASAFSILIFIIVATFSLISFRRTRTLEDVN
jgi:ABC-type sugar transport system permease subunit